jgi:prevent-host-death family protein
MKTASVRDLRNRYTSLLKWIGAGEEIVITQRGKAVARLIPEKTETAKRADWSKSEAVKRNRTKEPVLTAEESAKLIHESSSSW